MSKPIIRLIDKTTVFFFINCILCFCLTLLLSWPACALNNKNKSSNLDENQPIAIHSDAAEFDDEKGTASYYGHVVMEQGSRRLKAETLIIKRDSEGKIDSLVAQGKPAHFQAQSDPHKPLSLGHAAIIQYYPKEDKIILIQNAELTQNEESIQGEHLTYFITKKVLTSDPVRGKRTTVILIPHHQKQNNKTSIMTTSKKEPS